MTWFEILSLLMVGHALADYPIQATWIATTKNHRAPHSSGYPWYHSLTAHAVIHGGFVGVITGSVWLGYAEAFVHWIIDYGKSEGLFGVNVDQTLHVICKIVWVIILVNFMGLPS